MTPETARNTLAQLEAVYAPHLALIPPGVRDRWDTELMTMADSLGVDLTDAAQVRATFAGAYLATVTLYPQSAIHIGQMQVVLAMLRNLADRTDSTSMVDEIATWLKNQ